MEFKNGDIVKIIGANHHNNDIGIGCISEIINDRRYSENKRERAYQLKDFDIWYLASSLTLANETRPIESLQDKPEVRKEGFKLKLTQNRRIKLNGNN